MGTPQAGPSGIVKLRRLIVGSPRNVEDPGIFHRVSLVAFLAWVGLGADGLSSSAYGPDEAYRALGSHAYLALILIGMTTVTIAVISIAYSNLIKYFPGGGGGYLVATKLLGNQVGVVSGCALLVDYVLTISVSVASACDQIWSVLPRGWEPLKLVAEFAVLGGLVLINLRGVRESVTLMAPIFLLFIVTHAFMIVYAIGSHAGTLPAVFHGATVDFHDSVRAVGLFPILLILFRAYSLGGGTYTGIEAVSNGVATLREPRVQTGQRTMALMAFSLAFTAGGILLGYLLTRSQPVEGQTMNAVLLTNLFGKWQAAGVPVGAAFVVVSLFAEAALLVVAAQAGFLDGPRVLANMAVDSWTPHRFAALSERLVTQNGIVMMGLAAAATLVYTRGNITTLVVMYSINVFITFSLTELGMARHWIKDRASEPTWKRYLFIHSSGLVMCLSILAVTVFEKFTEGGWITLVITGGAIGLCYWVRAHYAEIRRDRQRLDDVLMGLPAPPESESAGEAGATDRNAPTAVVCVASFSGFGLHQILSIHRSFPSYFANFVFLSAAVVDSGVFKGAEEVERLKATTEDNLQRYVAWARTHGLRADYRMAVGTEAVSTTVELCRRTVEEYPRAVVFVGKLIFRQENWYDRLLHNQTALAIERRLHFQEINAVVLPIRVFES